MFMTIQQSFFMQIYFGQNKRQFYLQKSILNLTVIISYNSLTKEMDFQTMMEILPKKSILWTTQDVAKWLEFINLHGLVDSFRQAGIDGSCVHLLDDQVMKSELNIISPIIRKKLINWVGFGLENFNKHITDKGNKMINQIPMKNLELKKSVTTHLRRESKSKLIAHEETNNDNQQCLILQQFQGNSLGFHIIKNEILSIGFGKNNNIHSLQTSISERHALVGRKNGIFFIQDLGSKYGTYIKINHRTLLKNNMILQIGSYQFLVTQMSQANQTLKLKQIYTSFDSQKQHSLMNQNQNRNILNLQDNKNKQENKIKKVSKNMTLANSSISSFSLSNPNSALQILTVDLKNKRKFTFGRRKQNDYQKDDKHMSGMHCKITFFNGCFYIEDYGSTNGTWIRISQQNVISAEIPIQNQSYVKLGTAITYICRISNTLKDKSKPNKTRASQSSKMIDQNLCQVCQKQQNNCLLLPCSHNITCIQCAQIMEDCSECGQEIGEKVKIHK